MKVPPPDKYESWLDYAIDTMDTRSEHTSRVLAAMDLDQPQSSVPSREQMRQAAMIELDDLRKAAT